MDISTFNNLEFGEIRTIQKNGDVLFCGSDIARALGYARPADAISAHCKGVCVLPTPSAGGFRIQSLSQRAMYTALSLTANFPAQNVLRDGYLMRFFPLSASTAHT